MLQYAQFAQYIHKYMYIFEAHDSSVGLGTAFSSHAYATVSEIIACISFALLSLLVIRHVVDL